MPKAILTVDDSISVRQVVSFALKDAGYDTVEAIDGRDALGKLTGGVQLVITDLNMPNMDGLQLVKALRAKPEFKGTPILFLTTRNTDADKQQGRAARRHRLDHETIRSAATSAGRQ